MKNFIKNPSIIYPIIIIISLLIFVLLFGNVHCSILSDRGRELIIPQEILNGQIPYKDITLIYFPLAYYINAFFYKIFGISIYTFFITQTVICTSYMLLFYALSKEFINKTTSLLLTLFIISSCIFARNDLFSLFFPYSFARAYGCMISLLVIFCLIKLFKTDNIKFLYIAAFFTGFALCCKLEFVVTLILFLFGLFLYKKLSIIQYFKLFLVSIIMPVLLCFLLFYQGVSFTDIVNAIKFGINFSKTPVMTEFLSMAGVYPYDFVKKLETMMTSISTLVMILLFTFIAFKLEHKYSKKHFLYFFAIIIIYFYFNTYNICLCWLFLPYIISIVFLINFKDNLKNDKVLFLLLLSSILLGQREFFSLRLDCYGTFSFPIYILSLLVIIKKYLPPEGFNINVRRFTNFVLIVLFCMHFHNLYLLKEDQVYPLSTVKGTLYTKYSYGVLLNNTINYINRHIDKDATILILPEGNLINFLTDRKVDMHCFMMDRLYHDAYGEEKAKEVIEKTNSDYIILLKGFDLNNFNLPYIYGPKNSLSGLYIAQNYYIVKKYKMDYSSVIILKKIEKITNINLQKINQAYNEKMEQDYKYLRNHNFEDIN